MYLYLYAYIWICMMPVHCWLGGCEHYCVMQQCVGVTAETQTVSGLSQHCEWANGENRTASTGVVRSLISAARCSGRRLSRRYSFLKLSRECIIKFIDTEKQMSGFGGFRSALLAARAASSDPPPSSCPGLFSDLIYVYLSNPS